MLRPAGVSSTLAPSPNITGRPKIKVGLPSLLATRGGGAWGHLGPPGGFGFVSFSDFMFNNKKTLLTFEATHTHTHTPEHTVSRMLASCHSYASHPGKDRDGPTVQTKLLFYPLTTGGSTPDVSACVSSRLPAAAAPIGRLLAQLRS